MSVKFPEQPEKKMMVETPKYAAYELPGAMKSTLSNLFKSMSTRVSTELDEEGGQQPVDSAQIDSGRNGSLNKFRSDKMQVIAQQERWTVQDVQALDRKSLTFGLSPTNRDDCVKNSSGRQRKGFFNRLSTGLRRLTSSMQESPENNPYAYDYSYSCENLEGPVIPYDGSANTLTRQGSDDILFVGKDVFK